MSIREVRLPDIGEGVTEAEIVEWLVSVGDVVEEDQVIGSVMTDKAAVEIPSPVAGVIASLGGEIGDVVAVGAVLARIDVGTVAVDAVGAVENFSIDETVSVEAAVAHELPYGNGSESGESDLGDAGDKDDKDDKDESANIEPDVKVLAAPAVRQRARERGVALDEVAASGNGGRVTHSDLDRFLFDAGSGDCARAHPIDRVEELRVTGLRRQIARQMEIASRRIPHFSYIEEVDVSALESLRHSLGSSSGDDGEVLSPLPFIILAIVRSLDAFPAMNARYDDEADVVHRHTARHVGFATQTSAGLIVPVVRFSERLGIRALAAEIRRLAEAARDGRITHEELTGGTITITSLGALGGLASTPIINHPQVAIVGVNRIVTRPVCRGEQIVTRQMMNLSSSFDHRVVDGYDAACFVQCIRSYLENPATLLLSE